LTASRAPSLTDWANVLKPDRYAFARSWHFRTMLVASGALSLLATYGMLRVQRSVVLNAIELSLLGISWMFLLWPYKDPETRMQHFRWLFEWQMLCARIRVMRRTDAFVALVLFLILIRSVIVVTAVFVFAIIGYSILLPDRGPVVSFSLLLLFGLWRYGQSRQQRREHAARNPLHGLFKNA
jgi:hypothetical protein